MVEEHVGVADRFEQIGASVAERRRHGRRERLVLQMLELGPGHQLADERGDREGTALVVHVRVRQVQCAGEELRDRLFGRRIDLQPDRAPAVAAAHLPFDGDEQVLGLFLIDVEVPVARHAERPAALDGHVGKEQREVPRDDVLQQHRAAGHSDQTRQERRDRHHAVPQARFGPGREADGQVERLVAQVGKGMGGVQSQAGPRAGRTRRWPLAIRAEEPLLARDAPRRAPGRAALPRRTPGPGVRSGRGTSARWPGADRPASLRPVRSPRRARRAAA